MKTRRKVSILLIVLTFVMSINITAFASQATKIELQQEELYSSGELNKIETNAFRNESLWGLVTVGTDNVVMYTVQDTDDLRTTTVISKWSDFAFMSDSFSTGKNIAHQVY